LSVNSYGIVRALYTHGTEGGVNAKMRTELVGYLARIQSSYTLCTARIPIKKKSKPGICVGVTQKPV
jgi:hypothetical protein